MATSFFPPFLYTIEPSAVLWLTTRASRDGGPLDARTYRYVTKQGTQKEEEGELLNQTHSAPIFYDSDAIEPPARFSLRWFNS